jgi:hypothetical protein
MSTKLPNFTIKSDKKASRIFREKGIYDFHSACSYVQQFPYRRTTDPSDSLLVMKEEQGTCSSKHALLAMVAEENKVQSINLIVGIYKMTPRNTAGIGLVFPPNISFIPEAHTYLVFNKHRFDFTHMSSEALKDADILEEVKITPSEIGTHKKTIHQTFLKKWCRDQQLDFEAIWTIRELCIQAITDYNTGK